VILKEEPIHPETFVAEEDWIIANHSGTILKRSFFYFDFLHFCKFSHLRYDRTTLSSMENKQREREKT
jgi:hypothetical protein